jgi:2-oxoglutarate ferredoxin oxidoreductase subunit alpha
VPGCGHRIVVEEASVEENVRFLQGNEAIAEGALYAGLQFYAGYPITPSTEVAEILSERLPEIGRKVIIYVQKNRSTI